MAGVETMVAILVGMHQEILFPRSAHAEIGSREQRRQRLVHQALSSASRIAGMTG